MYGGVKKAPFTFLSAEGISNSIAFAISSIVKIPMVETSF